MAYVFVNNNCPLHLHLGPMIHLSQPVLSAAVCLALHHQQVGACIVTFLFSNEQLHT